MSWVTEEIALEPAFDVKKWIITGWYEEEVKAYNIAERAWEHLQSISGPYNKLKGNSSNLDIVDDYFRWNVIHPQWYLWKDGTWNKDSVQLIGKRYIKMTEFISKVSASMALKNSVIPAEFVNYKEHLQSAAPPGNLINNSESMHNI